MKQTKIALGYFITLVAVCPSTPAYAWTVAGECVTQYAACGNDNIPNACANLDGFTTKLAQSGHGVLRVYKESAVYDTDSVDNATNPLGRDYVYTDNWRQTPTTNTTLLEYYSMHGTCGQIPHALGSCTTDANCQAAYGAGNNLVWGCDFISHTCAGYEPGDAYYDPGLITCSSADQFQHFADLTNNVRFGEYPSINWGGAGNNGDLNFAVFDTSCPFAPPQFLTHFNAQVFTGLHIEMGYATAPLGDIIDNPTRGGQYATRLLASQSVAHAWGDVSRFEGAAAACNNGGMCTISMSCDGNSTLASNHINNETFGNSGDAMSPPNYCSWYMWCC